MRERFLDFIKKHALIGSGERVLLAVSGGLDSMAMLHLFSQTDIPFAIAHCNFGLRGEESDGDEQFVKDQAEALGVECFLTKFDTLAYAREHQQSTQMAARNLRYGWFNTLCREQGFHKLAIAQHLDDSLETVLFNFAKGTSIAGLRGILPISSHIIRPLLDFTREELYAMMLDEHLPWREDSSNKDTHYQRNFIRHEIVKDLKQINPDLLNTFRNSMNRMREVEEVFDETIESKRKELVEWRYPAWFIEKAKVTGPYVLEKLLAYFEFSYGQALDIWSIKDGQPGKCFYTREYELVVDREHFVVSRRLGMGSYEKDIQKGDTEFHIDSRYFKLREVETAAIEKKWMNERHAVLDFEKLKFPLKVRKVKEGDSFRPLGMKGKKKLSDFMIDRKIPVNLKNRLSVLESAGEIVWVIGMRIDDRFKVTEETTKAFCLIDRFANV